MVNTYFVYSDEDEDDDDGVGCGSWHPPLKHVIIVWE
jgi:hypothetical protein